MQKPHKKLDVWQKSMDLVADIYSMTRRLPDDERFGMVVQMRRAAVSIPVNLAEGAARQGNAQFLHFVHIAMGSPSELDTQLETSYRLGLISQDEWLDLGRKLTQVDQMLIGLRNYLRRRKKPAR